MLAVFRLVQGGFRDSALRRDFQRSLLVQKYLLGWDEIFTACRRAGVRPVARSAHLGRLKSSSDRHRGCASKG
jgi:hypothetical protein